MGRGAMDSPHYSHRPRGLRHLALCAIVAALLLPSCAITDDEIADYGLGHAGSAGTADVKAQSLIRVGDRARDAGDLGTALGVYRRASELNSSDPLPLLRLADTLNRAGWPDQAVEVYEKLLSRDDKNRDALRGLGTALMALGRPAEALPKLDEALYADPEDVRSVSAKGLALDMLGRHAQAQLVYRDGLKTSPDHRSLRNNLALSLAISGNYPEAIGVLRDLARSPASTAQVRQNLALVLGLSGATDEAERVARLDLDPASVQRNLQLYATLRQLKDPTAVARAVGLRLAEPGETGTRSDRGELTPVSASANAKPVSCLLAPSDAKSVISEAGSIPQTQIPAPVRAEEIGSTPAPEDPAPPPDPAPVATHARFRIQLAEFSTFDRAVRSFDYLRGRLGPTLQATALVVEESALRTRKAVSYRVRSDNLFTKGDARALCRDIRDRNGACLVVAD